MSGLMRTDTMSLATCSSVTDLVDGVADELCRKTALFARFEEMPPCDCPHHAVPALSDRHLHLIETDLVGIDAGLG